MIATAYVTEAGRAVTAATVDRGEKPAVISALMKYQTTERLRRSVNDAMDLHGGRAIADGPANYLQSAYQMLPTAVTVEGANIVARAHDVYARRAALPPLPRPRNRGLSGHGSQARPRGFRAGFPRPCLVLAVESDERVSA
jgi:hypothetical protein